MEQPHCRTCCAIDLSTLKTVGGNDKALCRSGGPTQWEEVIVDVDWCCNHPVMRELAAQGLLPLSPPP